MQSTHKSKWLSTMIEKHGSEEAVRDFMRQSGTMSARNTGKGGFASLDETARKEVSTKGGLARAEKYRQTHAEDPTEDENATEGKETDNDQA